MRLSYKHIFIIIATTIVTALALMSCGSDKEPQQEPESNKAERNFIREGNKLFANGDYADAEIQYSKALQANPSSAIAAYNMGLALAKQAAPNDSTGIIERADSLFEHAASLTADKKLRMMAFYNKGNLAYNAQHFDKAIDNYKNALRAVPTDEESRYNLRMAQLKLQEQQQQQQNKDNNKDQNQDQNQQNKDQNQQNQDQNQQNKDQNQQNQVQNQDQQNQDQNQQNQNQQNQQQNQQNKDQQQQQNQQQQQQGGQKNQQGQAVKMNDQSVQQALKAIQDKEKETQQRIYQAGERQREQQRRATQNKW